MKYSFRHVSETAVTLVAVLSSLFWPMTALNLATSSACARPRSLTSMLCGPGPLPDRVGFSLLTDALRPARAGRRLPAGRQPRSAPACPAAPRACPAVRPGLVPGAVQPEADGAFAPDCHQGHRSAEPVPAEPYLPVSLTGLALAHRPSQVKPHRLPQHRKARPLQAGLGCRLQQPAAFCVFPGGCTATGRIEGKYHGTRHNLSLTTARQRQGARGKRAVFRPPIVSTATAVLSRPAATGREHQLGRSRCGDSAVGWPSPQRVTAPGGHRQPVRAADYLRFTLSVDRGGHEHRSARSARLT